MESVVLERLKLVRYDAQAHRRVFSAPMMVIFSICGAMLTGAMAQLTQVRLPLLGTPIPFTGEVFAVLLCGGLLGSGYGLLSQALFIAAALAGVPWLAHGEVKMGVLIAPTAGYLVGFMAAAYYVGLFTKATAWGRTIEGRIVIMLGGSAMILLFGATYLFFTTNWSAGEVLAIGVLPFVSGDMVKVALAAMLTYVVLPKNQQ